MQRPPIVKTLRRITMHQILSILQRCLVITITTWLCVMVGMVPLQLHLQLQGVLGVAEPAQKNNKAECRHKMHGESEARSEL